MGTFSVISIMVSKVVAKYAENPDTVNLLSNSTSIPDISSDHLTYSAMHVVSSLCIVMACFHVTI